MARKKDPTDLNERERAILKFIEKELNSNSTCIFRQTRKGWFHIKTR